MDIFAYLPEITAILYSYQYKVAQRLKKMYSHKKCFHNKSFCSQWS